MEEEEEEEEGGGGILKFPLKLVGSPHSSYTYIQLQNIIFEACVSSQYSTELANLTSTLSATDASSIHYKIYTYPGNSVTMVVRNALNDAGCPPTH